jgi:hypothetical protein
LPFQISARACGSSAPTATHALVVAHDTAESALPAGPPVDWRTQRRPFQKATDAPESPTAVHASIEVHDVPFSGLAERARVWTAECVPFQRSTRGRARGPEPKRSPSHPTTTQSSAETHETPRSSPLTAPSRAVLGRNPASAPTPMPITARISPTTRATERIRFGPFASRTQTLLAARLGSFAESHRRRRRRHQAPSR